MNTKDQIDISFTRGDLDLLWHAFFEAELATHGGAAEQFEAFRRHVIVNAMVILDRRREMDERQRDWVVDEDC